MKSGLRILIQASEVPFLVPSKWIKRGVLVILGTIFFKSNFGNEDGLKSKNA